MSTTSNSPGRARFWLRLGVAVACGVVLVIVLTTYIYDDENSSSPLLQENDVAPDAPRPRPTEAERPPSAGRDWLQPVELDRVVVRPLDETLFELVGEEFLETARDPLVIEVYTQKPLDLTPRTSWPVIVWNGEVLENSRGLREGANMLIAFLPDRELLRQSNMVEVFWVGNEQLTRTREPFEFSIDDIE